jgi:hypothetical protein
VRPILFLARAEVLHVVRDRATLAQCLIVPIVQLLVLSNAATFQIRNTPTYVVDLDRSSASRGLVTRFAASGHFRVAAQSASLDLANDALLRGDVTMVLTIPRDFEASLVRTAAAPVELSVNAEKGSARPTRPPSCRRTRPSSPQSTPVPWRASLSGERRSTSGRAAGTTRRSTTATTWCRAFSSRW